MKQTLKQNYSGIFMGRTKSEEKFDFKKILTSYFIFVIGSLFVAFSILLWLPEYTYFIIEEDHLVENISAFSYLTAFFLGIWILTNYSSWRKLTWLVTIIGLIGFLDELSFGTRFFEFTEPELLNKNINAVHDFITIGYVFLENIIGFYGILSLVVAFVIGSILLYMYQQKYRLENFIGDPTKPPGLFLVMFFLFVLLAQVADLKDFIAPLVIIEELFELFGGVALCFYSLSLAKILEAKEISEPILSEKVVESE